MAAAQACGFSPARPEKCAVALEEWSTRRGTTLGELVHAQEEWAELQALLAGRNLADLEEAARAADLEASQLEATVAPALLESPIRDESDTVIHASANQLPPASSSPKSWEDVGAELRMMLYDLIHRFREEIRKR